MKAGAFSRDLYLVMEGSWGGDLLSGGQKVMASRLEGVEALLKMVRLVCSLRKGRTADSEACLRMFWKGICLKLFSRFSSSCFLVLYSLLQLCLLVLLISRGAGRKALLGWQGRACNCRLMLGLGAKLRWKLIWWELLLRLSQSFLRRRVVFSVWLRSRWSGWSSWWKSQFIDLTWELRVREYLWRQRWNSSRALQKERRSRRPLSVRYSLKRGLQYSLLTGSVLASIRWMSLRIISLWEPWSLALMLWLRSGWQLGWCLEMFGFIQTLTLPSWVKKIISQVMSKKPTCQQSCLKPSRQPWQRQRWSAKGMSLISFSLSSTFATYSSPLQIVEHSSATDVFVKYFTLQMYGELSLSTFSLFISIFRPSSFRNSTSREQLLKSSWLRNCSSYSSISSFVFLFIRRRFRYGLTLAKRLWEGSSIASIHSPSWMLSLDRDSIFC